MIEGERSRIDGLKNSVKEIVLEDPGMEEAYIASTDDSYHGQMNNSSQFLTDVESMHLMEGHPFRDIVRLLRNYSLFYNPSTWRRWNGFKTGLLYLFSTFFQPRLQSRKKFGISRRWKSLVVLSLCRPCCHLFHAWN